MPRPLTILAVVVHPYDSPIGEIIARMGRSVLHLDREERNGE
jgi:hypothetical protein